MVICFPQQFFTQWEINYSSLFIQNFGTILWKQNSQKTLQVFFTFTFSIPHRETLQPLPSILHPPPSLATLKPQLEPLDIIHFPIPTPRTNLSPVTHLVMRSPDKLVFIDLFYLFLLDICLVWEWFILINILFVILGHK